MGILEKLKELEAEYNRTQKNKATEYHLGQLKAKIAKLRTQLLEGSSAAGGGPGAGFDVAKTGHARVALIGFPSVGKSTILTKLTGTESVAAAYECVFKHPPRACARVQTSTRSHPSRARKPYYPLRAILVPR